MKRRILLVAAMVAGLSMAATPALACHRDYSGHRYSDRHGYYDDDCDSDGYYCDGYGYYRFHRDDYRYHRRYYRDGRAGCVFHEQVGAITVEFLCDH